MEIIFKFILLISVFTLAYLLLTGPSKVDKKILKQLNNYDKGGESRSNNEKLKNILLKLPFAKTQEQLDKTGNKFNLNPITYVTCKVGTSVLAFVLIMADSGNVALAAVFSSAGFFIIDILMRMDRSKELDLIRLDLEDVYRTLKIKDKKNNKIYLAIEEAADAAVRCNRLREELLIAALTMKVTDQYEKALNDFQGKFQYAEIRHFVKAIKSYKDTGELERSIEGQLSQLQKKNKAYHDLEIFHMKEKGESFSYLYFIGAAMLLALAMSTMMSGIMTQIIS